jgi:hypothetical protein
MKMKYLKKFENFSSEDMGRFSDDVHPTERSQEEGREEEESSTGCPNCGEHNEECPECRAIMSMRDEEQEEEEESQGEHDEFEEEPHRVWGDEEMTEKKKFNFEKKGEKKEKKEPKKEEKKEGKKGLTAAQRKLPAGLQAAILKKKK